MKEIYLAGGCFWGTEKYLANINGVIETDVGYANGKTKEPTYEQVCKHNTGHAETVRIKYDLNIVTLNEILDYFYEVINPTVLNRQGADIGEQYRTGIYYVDLDDKLIIAESLKKLQVKYKEPIVIEVSDLKHYYIAEEYHQKYLDKNPNGYCHIPAKMLEKQSEALKYRKKTKTELENSLTDLQYDVTQNSATEKPFTGEYDKEFRAGIYVDRTTGEPLFISADKFDAGCGWPSFSKPIKNNIIQEVQDNSNGKSRVEVRSKIGDSHLGHVFSDGPTEMGGLRYCINSASLIFIPLEKMEIEGYSYLMGLIDTKRI